MTLEMSRWIQRLFWAFVMIAGAVFGGFNYSWWHQREILRREGVATEGQVTAVSHSSWGRSNTSTVTFRYSDTGGRDHLSREFVPGASRIPGQAIHVIYLPADPDAVAIDDREAPMPDSHFQTGMLIGGGVALLAAVMIALDVRRRSY